MSPKTILNHDIAIILALAMLAIGFGFPPTAHAQFIPQRKVKTRDALKLKIRGKISEATAGDVHNLVSEQTNVYLVMSYSHWEKGSVSTNKEESTLKELLDQIDDSKDLKVVLRQENILIVSDVSDEKIAKLDKIIRDKSNPDRTKAIDELLTYSHPHIYPTAFWIMAHDDLETATKTLDALAIHHSYLMEFAEDYDNFLSGYKRIYRELNQRMSYSAMNFIPTAVYKDLNVDDFPTLDGEFKKKIQFGSLSLDKLKVAYIKAPPSPAVGLLCGTGYQHTYNHLDYARRINELRTEASKEFLVQQVARHAKNKDHRNLAELANVFSTWDSDDAIKIAYLIAQEQKLDRPADNISAGHSPVAISPIKDMLDRFDKTQLKKYVPVFRKFCNSSDSAVKETAFTILKKRDDPEVLSIGLKSLDHFHQQWSDAKTIDDKRVIDGFRAEMGRIMWGLRTQKTDELFSKRLKDPDRAIEAAGYFSWEPSKQSTDNLQTIHEFIDAESVFWKTKMMGIMVRTELIKRNDRKAIQIAGDRLKQRYIGLNDYFRASYSRNLNYKLFNGLSIFLEQDVDESRNVPETIELGFDLLDERNTKPERTAGAMLIYTAKRSLVTTEVRERLESYKKDSDPWIAGVISAMFQ